MHHEKELNWWTWSVGRQLNKNIALIVNICLIQPMKSLLAVSSLHSSILRLTVCFISMSIGWMDARTIASKFWSCSIKFSGGKTQNLLFITYFNAWSVFMSVRAMMYAITNTGLQDAPLFPCTSILQLLLKARSMKLFTSLNRGITDWFWSGLRSIVL